MTKTVWEARINSQRNSNRLLHKDSPVPADQNKKRGRTIDLCQPWVASTGFSKSEYGYIYIYIYIYIYRERERERLK